MTSSPSGTTTTTTTDTNAEDKMLMQPQRITQQRITQQGQLLQEPLPAQ
ncbi:MAG: hypothetical protein ACLURV_05030 [Gallintestinimicrobium sp.]